MEAGSRPRPPWSWREQVAGVDEIAVVTDRERPPRPEAVGRLGVLPDGGACRRIAAMGDRELTAQARQPPLVEHRADHPEVLVEHQLLAVADREAGQFLAAMLEREEAERRDRCRVGRLAAREDHAEHAAHQGRLRRPAWLPAERAAESVFPGVTQVAKRDLDRVGDPASPLFCRARRAGATELDDETVAADRADRLDREAELASQAARALRHSEAGSSRRVATVPRRTGPPPANGRRGSAPQRRVRPRSLILRGRPRARLPTRPGRRRRGRGRSPRG